MGGRLDRMGICTAPIQTKQLGGSVSLELPFLDGRLNVFSFVQRRRRRVAAWKQYIQTPKGARDTPGRRCPPMAPRRQGTAWRD